MLGREYLHFRRSGKRYLPVFADTSAPSIRNAASELIMVYQEAALSGRSREELDELRAPVFAADRLHAPGLGKLLDDGAVFEPAGEWDYRALRAGIFARAGELLGHAELAEYRARALEGFTGDLYGDLPEHEKLVSLRSWTVDALLDRYNVAQVQGLLLYAARVRVELLSPEAGELRMLFHYLKFFRLLAKAERSGENILLEIDGPLSVLEQTRKYALLLASFFPAVCRFARWKLAAEINLDGRSGRLELDETSALRSHYRNFGTYVPEEVAMFRSLFRDKVDAWRIAAETPLLPGERGALFAPDMAFVPATGRGRKREVYLELFHRWHRGRLTERLDYAAAHPELRLMIGIDRAIASDETFAGLEKRYPALTGHLFRFRDFPGVDRVRRVLASFSDPPVQKTAKK